MSDPRVTIVLRSFNEGWALRETLPALRQQAYGSWDLIVFDSGSTDGSVALIEQARPRQFVRLPPSEYNPARVLNHGMRLAESNAVIFLNADATPQGSHWLGPLVSALTNARTAAVFGRQIPRPDCQAVFACDYQRCFGPDCESARWPHFFSMVSSGIRKDIWAQRGFLEQLQYAEDDEYTRWCKTQGYDVVYCPESVVMHSHNYSPEQAYRRSYGDAKAFAMSSPLERRRTNWWRTFLLGWLSDFRHDIWFCLSTRRWKELPHAAHIRGRQRKGKLDGLRAGWAVPNGRATATAPKHVRAEPRL